MDGVFGVVGVVGVVGGGWGGWGGRGGLVEKAKSHPKRQKKPVKLDQPGW